MPVENEDKIVLREPEILRDALSGRTCLLIDQFYLNLQVRYRRITRIGAGAEHLFTFKQSIGGRLLEQEFPVPVEDYDLARTAAVMALSKVRFPVDAGPGVHWDVDFLLDAPATEGGKLYFPLAEVEFPEGGSYEIPDFLAPHVLAIVPRELSPAFSNVRLSDRDYAARLWRALLSGLSPAEAVATVR